MDQTDGRIFFLQRGERGQGQRATENDKEQGEQEKQPLLRLCECLARYCSLVVAVWVELASLSWASGVGETGTEGPRQKIEDLLSDKQTNLRWGKKATYSRDGPGT